MSETKEKPILLTSVEGMMRYVRLQVFNILGEVVATLVEEELNAGTYTTQWNATRVASGVYLYRLQAGDFVDIKKMLLLK